MRPDRLRQLAQWLGSLRGWRRWGAAITLGAVGFLSMPPIGWVPCLAIGITGLVWLLDGAWRPRTAFIDGWLWGMGFFVPCLYWVAASMFVDIAQFWWMVPFSVLGLPALMSTYLAVLLYLRQMMARPAGVSRIIAFAGCWTLAEWLRGHLLSGFPWMLAGYVWSEDRAPILAVLQTASFLGIYNLSFFTVLICAAPAMLADAAPLGRRILPVAVCVLALVLAMVWGFGRLGTTEQFQPDKHLRIISSDVPQRVDPDAASEFADFNHVLDLARRPATDRIDAAIWPEGDAPFPLGRDRNARTAIAGTVGADGIVIAGTVRVAGSGPDVEAWNSVAVVGNDGRIIGDYDKHHLVPFGEYVPLHRWLDFSKIASQRFDFSTGPGPVTLALPNLPPVAPIICYEAIFPDEIVDESNRPGWMVNVTDDGWFGSTTGPAQHFAIARVRAVEEGLPLVRAANGGISALIDPFGRVLRSSPPSVAAVLDVTLPDPLPPSIFYVYFHLWMLILLIIYSVLADIVINHRRRY